MMEMKLDRSGLSIRDLELELQFRMVGDGQHVLARLKLDHLPQPRLAAIHLELIDTPARGIVDPQGEFLLATDAVVDGEQKTALRTGDLVRRESLRSDPDQFDL